MRRFHLHNAPFLDATHVLEDHHARGDFAGAANAFARAQARTPEAGDENSAAPSCHVRNCGASCSVKVRE